LKLWKGIHGYCWKLRIRGNRRLKIDIRRSRLEWN